MDSNNFLQKRVTNVFGIFMIFVYAAIGILLLLNIMWVDLPMRKALGIVLLIWAGFRTYMLFKLRSRMKNDIADENN